MQSINFTVTKKIFFCSCNYNEANSFLFVNGTEIYKFKAKDSVIVASSLSLGNICKDWSIDRMKKTAFNGMSIILVQIMIPLMLMMLKTFISI